MHSTDIVAYTHTAELVCGDCMRKAYGETVITENGDHAAELGVSVETLLDMRAAAQRIDRHDERSFDSGDFPKVVFADDVSEDDACDRCGELILENWVPVS